MDTRLTVLGVFLRELGQPFDISTRDNRLRTQKAVYLGQLSGVDLGYRYNWYVHGPYSPSLTQDYYTLDGLMAEARDEISHTQFNEQTKTKLSAVLPLFVVPPDVDLELHNWLELLCSWHYLLKVVKYNADKALETLRSEKPHVVNYVPQANAVLLRSQYI